MFYAECFLHKIFTALVGCFLRPNFFINWHFVAIAVSRDHKPDQTDERQRIEDAGGFVMWAGTFTFLVQKIKQVLWRLGMHFEMVILFNNFLI